MLVPVMDWNGLFHTGQGAMEDVELPRNTGKLYAAAELVKCMLRKCVMLPGNHSLPEFVLLVWNASQECNGRQPSGDRAQLYVVMEHN